MMKWEGSDPEIWLGGEGVRSHSINLVLVYDVLYYFEAAGRKNLYIQFHSWLKPGGMLFDFLTAQSQS